MFSDVRRAFVSCRKFGVRLLGLCPSAPCHANNVVQKGNKRTEASVHKLHETGHLATELLGAITVTPATTQTNKSQTAARNLFVRPAMMPFPPVGPGFFLPSGWLLSRFALTSRWTCGVRSCLCL